MSEPNPSVSYVDVVANEAVATIKAQFGAQLARVPRPPLERVLQNSAVMLLLARQGTDEHLHSATSKILPTHIRYTLIEGFIEEVRKHIEDSNTVPRLSLLFETLGDPVSRETLESIFDGKLDKKKVAICLNSELWGKEIDRTDLDTAYTKMRHWDRTELESMVTAMLLGGDLLQREFLPNRPSEIAKRWGILLGAYIERSASGDIEVKQHRTLSDLLLPESQRLAWLRDIWLRKGEKGFPDMKDIEPALESLSEEQMRQFARDGAEKLSDSERERSVDRSLRMMLNLVGVDVDAQKLRNARNRQEPFFEGKKAATKPNGDE